MNGAITFDANDLQTYNLATRVGIITNKIDHTDQPNKTASIFAVANANKSVIPSTEYLSKSIQISGVIVGSTQDDLDTRIDTFKGYLTGQDKNLDIDYGGSIRRYTATANVVSTKRQDKALFAEFSVDFVCPLPFGQDITPTTIGNVVAYTASTKTFEATLTGSAPFQYPIITITLNTITGTGDYIEISNNNNGQEMLFYGLGLTNGDVIVIDTFNRTVTINNVTQDYLGTFLELEKGAISINYTDGFDTRSVDIDVVYYKRYL